MNKEARAFYDSLEFKSIGHLTLGVEIEMFLLDPLSYDFKPVSEVLLKATAGKTEKIKPEGFKSMIEINSHVCKTATEAEADLLATLDIMKPVCEREKVWLASIGSHPFAKYPERQIFPDKRYRYLLDRNQAIFKRISTCGLHVHLGMKDEHACIAFHNFFLRFMPHLIALSASSPFWQDYETGLASWRSTVFESSPTCGHPCPLHSWKEYVQLCKVFYKSGSIHFLKDIWWDIRPSPMHGTLELRVCDGTATIKEAAALTAFIHALAHWFDKHQEAGEPQPLWLVRENKWRAARYGLEANIITDEAGNTQALADHIVEWLGRLEPIFTRLNYGEYDRLLREILTHGGSYVRQLAVYESTGSTQEVMAHSCREFEVNRPIWLQNTRQKVAR